MVAMRSERDALLGGGAIDAPVRSRVSLCALWTLCARSLQKNFFTR